MTEVAKPLSDLAFASKTWGVCPVCLRERRVKHGTMTYHRRYEAGSGTMQPCEGHGGKPSGE